MPLRIATLCIDRRPAILCSIMLPALLCATPGCALPYFLMSDKKQAVPAEYRDLTGKTVAVLVWADQATLDMDPYARHRVAKAVKYYMEKTMSETKFIHPNDVADWQERLGARWETESITEVCREFKCDRVVKIDLNDYTTRVRSARALRKGRITGTVNVYGPEDESGSMALFNSLVEASFPAETSTAVVDMSDGDILRQTVEMFGVMVARKFHDHEVSYTRVENR